jgi:hypothetical protein
MAPQGAATAQAATAASQQTPQAASVVPFLRASGKGKYKFYSKSGLTLTTATQDLGPIDVKLIRLHAVDPGHPDQDGGWRRDRHVAG